ncbi:hypothetical protein L208DRAFT_428610 [Tricholoma matsutake]|nr:hypothetical protein L208DRAFT_428610 [Tricholoma matsutake 945]
MDIAPRVDGLYWGVLVSTMLSGITVTQGLTYAHNNNDKWHLRLFVAVLILIDSAMTCLNLYILRYYLVSNFGNIEALWTFTKALLAMMGMSITTSYLSTLFFVSQFYILDKSSQWAAAIAAFFVTGYFIIMANRASS